jgi:glycine hydroxymethyltransferase
LKEVASPEFKEYIVQVKKNAKTLANTLKEKGFDIVTDGTDNHIVLWTLRKNKISGSKIEKLCDAVNITVNKNSVAGDSSMMNPSGIRLGTAALTTRGFVEADFEKVGEFLSKVVEIGLELQNENPDAKLVVDFEKLFEKNEKVEKLRSDVENFAKKFKMPGFDVNEFN